MINLNAADNLKRLNRIDFQAAARAKMKRKKRLPRTPRMLYPDSVERSYRRIMRAFVARMRNAVNVYLAPELKRILNDSDHARPTLDSAHLDEYDYSVEVTRLMEVVRSKFFGYYSEEKLRELIGAIALAVANQNGKQLGKVWSSVFGVDVLAAEPWLGIEMRAFVTQNVNLIVTIPQRYFSQIEEKVFNAARQGLSYKLLQKDIQKSYGSSKARAELIARDQIGKFNGQLNMLRQTQAGFRRYIWRTVKDERVRDEHKAREGLIFSWDAPPRGGHPGEDFQCRCQAEVVTEDLWTIPAE